MASPNTILHNNIRSRKLWIGLAVIFVAVAVITVFILFHGTQKKKSETYTLVHTAIGKTEALDDFIIQISSSSLITDGAVSQKNTTQGYIYTLEDKEFVYVYANTTSNTTGTAAEDFDVTVAMYSDGKHVYDNSTGKDELIEDMTCSEFNEIVAEYELYKYDEADVLSVAFNENTMAEGENNGDMIVTLSRPTDKVLASLAKGMASATGEAVSAEELTVLSAKVIYSIYDSMILSQSCSFEVSYKRADGKTVRYSTATNIVYVEEENFDDANIISAEQEDEQ